MKDKLVFIFISLVLLTANLNSQQISKISNNWYFGNTAGVNFNTRPSTPHLDGKINTQEGISTVSDLNGNLLFYTDGIRVWDKTHSVLNNTLLTGHNSSTQSALILPAIFDSNVYYIFTVDELANNNGLKYSELDISLPGNGTSTNPLGELVSGRVNINLISPISEKITGIIKKDNSGYWIIVHGWNNNEFYVFDVNCNGVNPIPQIYQVGATHAGGLDNINSVGYLKANIEGSKLALVNRNISGIETFDFNSTTGQISNAKFLQIPNESLYGVEFSFESKYLYIGGRSTIYQYNLDNLELNELQNINGVLNNDNVIRALQLGPDKMIYVSIRHLSFLSVIESPDSEFTNLNIEFLNLDPNNEGRNCRFGLPNIFYFNFIEKDTSTVLICPDETYSFNGEDFQANTINFINAVTSSGCDSTFILRIDTFPKYTLFEEFEICAGDTLFYQNEFILPGEFAEFSFNTVNNCDSTIFVSVTEIEEFETTDTITAFTCPNDSFSFNGEDYQANTINIINAVTSSGCDSTFILRIDTFPQYALFEQFEICASDTLFYQNEFILPGEFVEFSFNTVNNCDSTIFVSVTEIEEFKKTEDYTLCYGETHLIEGIEYSTNFDTLISIPGALCDTLVYYSLSFIQSPQLQFTNRPYCNDSNKGIISIELLSENDNLEFSIDGNTYSSEYLFTDLEAGNYYVYIKDSNDCIFTFETEIKMEESTEILDQLFIPNVININSIYNNCFQVMKSPDLYIPAFELHIYDRWGNLIFKSKDDTNCWKGYFNNRPVEQGVYVWLLKFEENNCETTYNKLLTGDITVLR